MKLKLKTAVVCAVVTCSFFGTRLSLATAPVQINVISPQVISYNRLPEVLKAIAKCESGDKQFNEDGSVVRGVDGHDYGRFQIRDIHFSEARKLGFNPLTNEGNIGYAIYLYEKNGTSDWRSSKSCWGQS